MNISTLTFLITLIIGTLIAVSSTSWFGVWMGLELNLLSFIPLMTQSNKYSSEAALKYFLTQAFASAVLLMGLMSFYMSTMSPSTTTILFTQIVTFAVLTKMGAAPLHFWFPEVSNGLAWTPNMILMTWQKIAPFIILFYLNMHTMIMMIVVISCALIGALGGFNQISLRKILAFSSINHMAWMIMSVSASQTLWILYFIIYSIMTLTMMNFFLNHNLSTLQQLPNISPTSSLEPFLISFNMLSMGGLPPFLGFLPKWMVMEHMINHGYFLVAFTMICLTLIVLYFYLRITYTYFMYFSTSLKPMIKNTIPLNFWLLWISLSGLIVCPCVIFW
uniref:NADH-ubiquinone oxidoreductase chain 2 n=1 Tax=Caenis sp. JYZ-2020 TaxID=2717116 RepID=A0A6G7SDC2_9INSE|nr:NADH dehydrogenase subunit 2 [Caenis sp. JYZ-2020]